MFQSRQEEVHPFIFIDTSKEIDTPQTENGFDFLL